MGVAFVWPVYDLAHVNKRETPGRSVSDPHEQCGASGLGALVGFSGLFRSGCE